MGNRSADSTFVFHEKETKDWYSEKELMALKSFPSMTRTRIW